MKIRTGFVSNSSTSSFIVKGFIVPREKMDVQTLFDYLLEKYPEFKEKWAKYDEDEADYEISYDLRDKGLYITDSEEEGAPKDSYIIGSLLQDTGSEGYIEDMTIDCSLDDNLTELKQVLEDITKEDLECKVIVGTRMC